MLLMDFAIIQRDSDGYGRAVFSGQLPKEGPDNRVICARAVREEDNLALSNWLECEINPDKEEWSISLTLPEGGLYRLEAIQTEKNSSNPEWSSRIKTLYHIGVGDVWLATGQSNMTGYGRDSAYDPPMLGVHALGNDGKWCIASQPLADAVNGIYEFPENATGTSPALSFARTLSTRLNLPIGIIHTAVGGTPLSFWSPEEDGAGWKNTLRRFELVDKVKGIIWYQGCSDCSAELAPTYLARFQKAVSCWRRDLADGSLPVLTVQLNRWEAENKHDFDRFWGILRDAQRQAALNIDNVYMVPALDLPCSDGIHNTSGANVIIGGRLANTALQCVYGKSGQTAALILRAERVDDTHLRLLLTEGHRVAPMDGFADGMNVEDENGMAECTAAAAGEDSLLVTVERPIGKNAVFHYAWRAKPPAFLPRDTHGMPLPACYGVKIEG